MLRRFGTATAALVVATTLGVGAPADAAPPPSVATAGSRSWTAPRSVSPFAGVPADVSCPTSSWCLAVDENGGTFTRTSGTWHRQIGLAPPYPRAGVFRSVSCTSTTFCLAALVDTGLAVWHGPASGWTVTSTDHYYTDVSCWATGACGVLRHSTTGVGGTFHRWTNGTLGAGTSIGTRTDPRELTCPTSTCQFLASYGSHTYVLRVSGSVFTSTFLTDDYSAQLSCASGTSCMAVTYDGYRRLVGYRWTAVQRVRGQTWILGGPTDVDCRPGTASCVVTGWAWSDGAAAHWNGSGWSYHALGGNANIGRFVDCPSASFCVAVDARGASSRWDGRSWSPRSYFDTARGGFTALDCVGSTDCVATDEYGNALEWKGSAWTRRIISDTPSRVDCGGSLCMTSAPISQTWRTRSSGTWGPERVTTWGPSELVVCATRTACFSTNGRDVMRFDGTAWHEPTRLPVYLGDAYGTRGDCPSTTFCMLVGAYGHTTSWNGSRWVDRGSVPGTAEGMVDIDCLGPNYCITRSDRGLAVLDGARWHTIAAPDSGGYPTSGIGCLSTTECYTVAGPSGTDLWRWTGSSWRPDATGVAEEGAGAATVRCVMGRRCLVVAGGSVAMTT